MHAADAFHEILLHASECHYAHIVERAWLVPQQVQDPFVASCVGAYDHQRGISHASRASQRATEYHPKDAHSALCAQPAGGTQAIHAHASAASQSPRNEQNESSPMLGYCHPQGLVPLIRHLSRRLERGQTDRAQHDLRTSYACNVSGHGAWNFVPRGIDERVWTLPKLCLRSYHWLPGQASGPWLLESQTVQEQPPLLSHAELHHAARANGSGSFVYASALQRASTTTQTMDEPL